MKNAIILFAALSFAAPTIAQNKPATQFPLATSVDSVSYAFGANIAQDLKHRGVKSLNTVILAKAMNDVFGNASLAVNQEKSLELIQEFLMEIDKQKNAVTIEAEKKFLAGNKTKAGISETPSGLQYEVIKAGNGAKPAVTDKVSVHYKGSLLNGLEFDSSYKRGEPLSLSLNQVIPGWSEGLQLMPLGSTYRFYIPYALGYGERGAGADIPPYSTLVFEVELISINPE